MHTIPRLQQLVEEKIKENISASSSEDLYKPINYILSIGGKRLRPVLCLMAAEMFGLGVQKALIPALGLEVFHNFTLIHDDIMDEAPLRRGYTTVHKKWNQNAAILSGDAMMIQAYSLIAKAETDVLPAVLSLFNTTALQVCEGQQWDMDFEQRRSVSISQYINMIMLKTSVLVGCSLKLGAILAKADQEDAENIYKFGINAGIAFQLQDDLLDVFGDSEKVGKQTGGDILSNKKTFLLLRAFEKADQETTAQLEKFFFSNEFNKSTKVEDVISIFNKLEIKEETERIIDEYFAKALQNLAQVKTPESSKAELLKFTENLMTREY